MLDPNKAQFLLRDFYSGGMSKLYRRKSVIIQYDQSPDSTYFIVEGSVKMISHDRRGNERIHYLYGSGDIFPVTWLFSERDFQIEFVAFTDVTLYSRSIKDTREHFEQEPYSLLSVVTQQTLAYERIVNLNIGNAVQRTAHRILTLCFKFGKKVDNHYIIDMPITLQDLADMVRLTREHTGTVVAELERKGCLVMGRRSIIVYDEQLKIYARY